MALAMVSMLTSGFGLGVMAAFMFESYLDRQEDRRREERVRPNHTQPARGSVT